MTPEAREYARKLIAAAPPLTAETKARLRMILAPAVEARAAERRAAERRDE